MTKINLVKVEESYQELRYKLNTYSSNRIKLELLRRFLVQLTKSSNKGIIFRSYYQELVPYLFELVTDENLEYRPLNVLQSFQDIFKILFALKIPEIKSSEFESVNKVLSLNLIKTNFYLGEWYRGFKVLNPKISKKKFQQFCNEFAKDFAEAPLINTTEKLVNNSQQLLSTNQYKKFQPIFLSIIDDWLEKTAQPRFGQIWTLLIEQESTDIFKNGEGSEKSVLIGTIQQIVGKVHVRSNDAEEDIILFNNRSISYNDLLFQQANDAIAAAKEILHKQHHKYYKITFSLPEKNPIYTGESLGLAMGLVNVSHISQIGTSKYLYQLKQDYAVTGSIDISGQAKPIADPSMKIKLETLIYSPFSSIVVAEKNQSVAERTIENSTKNNPNRKIDIVPVKTLEEALVRPQIALMESTPFRHRIKNIGKEWYFIFPLFSILLIITFLIMPSKIDKNPVELKIGGSKIVTYNIDGKKLWDYDFGFELDKNLYSKNSLPKRNRYLFRDINGDGRNELLFLTNSNNKYNGLIHVFDPNGKLLWRKHKNPSTGEQNITAENIYNAVSMFTHTKNENLIIFVLYHHHSLYPAYIVAYNIKGETIGEYNNAGHISTIKFIDIDEDSDNEILFGGTNNKYNTGILGILEFDFIKVDSLRIKEKYYIRFPVPPNLLFTNRADIFNIKIHSNKTIQIDESFGKGTTFPVYYIFNYNFDIINFVITDTYINDYRELTNHFLFHDYSENQLIKKFMKIEFWDGKKFVPSPVISNPKY